MINQYYSLTMTPESSVKVPVSQYDTESRNLIFRLYRDVVEEGDEYLVPEEAVVILSGAKPDGTVFSYLADHRDNTVTAEVQAQMTAVVGTTRCQLSVYQADALLGSAVFQLAVTPAVINDETQISENELAAVAELTRQSAASAQQVEAMAAEIQARYETVETDIQQTVQTAEASIRQTAQTAQSALGQSVTEAESAQEALEQENQRAETNIQTLGTKNTQGEQLAAALTTANATAASNITDLGSANTQAAQNQTQLDAKNAAAAENIAALESLDSGIVTAQVAQVAEYAGFQDAVLGLQVDWRTGECQRLGGAVGLTPGTDFDQFAMYGGRKRCTVRDDGMIRAWYGKSAYVEDGSNGQVMVFQPRFYYKMVPLVLEPIYNSVGYHVRKANYYISATPRDGFKLHPAFYDENGDPVDYFMEGAYCASLYDVSASAYLLADEQVGSFSASEDLLCSIAGAMPAGGSSQDLKAATVEQAAKNRGSGWHGNRIKLAAADQLLMLIEFGTINSQSVLGTGITGDRRVTGGTSSLGNASGTESGQEDGAAHISWRGLEDPWGNCYSFLFDLIAWGDGSMRSGSPYVCRDFNFAEQPNSVMDTVIRVASNYEFTGFTMAASSGYVKAMGYGNPDYDWLFLPSDVISSASNSMTGDYYAGQSSTSVIRQALHGGSYAGMFAYKFNEKQGGKNAGFGGRLTLVPTHNAETAIRNMFNWARNTRL